MPDPRGRSSASEQAPFARHAFERVQTAIGKGYSGARYEVLDRTGHEHLARLRVGGNACPDVDGDAADVVVAELDLSGVQAGADLDAESTHIVADAGSATNGACGAIERRKKSVTRRLLLTAAETNKLLAHQRVVLLEEALPSLIADAGRELGRADDIGEHDRRKHAVDRTRRPDSGEKLLHLIQKRILIADPGQMIVSRKLDKFGAGDPGRDVAPFLDVDVEIAGAMEDERRNADRRQDAADIDLRIHAQQRHRRTRARGPSPVRGKAAPKCFVAYLARNVVVEIHQVAPLALDELVLLLALFRRRRPRVVGTPGTLSIGIRHHERRGPLWEGRREQGAKVAALGHAEEGRALGANLVHHHAQ